MSVQSKPVMPYPVPKTFPTFLERATYRSYNWLENRLWPIRPVPFLTATAGITALNLRRALNVDDVKLLQFQTFDETHKIILKSVAISVGSTYLAVFLFRQFLKHFYFGYKGYLFENPKKPSVLTKIWGALRMLLLKIAPPKLSSCDRLLPNLPLPSLSDTVTRYVDSMQNILSEEEHEKLVALSKSFLKNEGKTLQRFAWGLQKCTDNYVTPLWEKFIYNAGRYPLLINSSVAQCTMYGESECIQAYQVARLIYIETLANLALDRQEYLAVGDGLLSTRHYKNIYNGCRIPGKEYDHFEWHKPAKHVVVVHQGTWYKAEICDKNGRLFTIEQIAKIITELMGRDDKESGVLTKVASLTTDGRTQWHHNRNNFFLNNKHNKQLLQTIETAEFVFSIDANLNWGVQTPEQLSQYMKDMLAGDGCNRWSDKTMNYAVDASGRGGATGEHSPCDGAELDHLCENVLNVDRQILEIPSKEEQLEQCKIGESDKELLILAKKLDFELVDGMGSEIERCFEGHQKATSDLHVHSMAFMDFGKGRIKKCGISPDGFLQMAIQLASYQDQGKFVLTYEPGSVRFYANSRTETLRPVTDASCKFVNAMMDQSSTNEERVQLLREACSTHVKNCRDVMTGKGIDRHLFVLCVMAKAFGYKSAFLDHYASQKWTLSTSNIPNMTNSIDEDSSEHNIMIGASFGAVAQDGYGICYRFGGNRSIMVHITSYHSSLNTDSDRFGEYLRKAFHQLADLFDVQPSDNNNDAK